MEVRFELGDLTKQEVQAVVNPANSEGEMGGGVAGALKKAGGKKIEQEAMKHAPIPIGAAILTTAGKLGCDYVIHAPTMAAPVQRTSVDKIYKAVQAALSLAVEYDIRSVAIPGMGTGTGRVPVEDAAMAMIEAIRASRSVSAELQELVLVDRNKELVEAWQSQWQQQASENQQDS